MEKYVNNLRVILCSNSTSRILDPIRSRCLLLRVASPSVPEMIDVLQNVADYEGLQLPVPFAQKIAEESQGNMRKALLMFEAAKVQK